MINLRFITNILGKLLLIESASLALCAGIALLYGEHDFLAFILSAAITLLFGTLMLRAVCVKDRILAKKDGYFIVTATWILFTLFGCLPFLISGTIPSIPDAIFETMSGFTTTGSTILSDVEALPHASLFWRSLTQWLGGLGIIVLLIAILPGLGMLPHSGMNGERSCFSSWILPERTFSWFSAEVGLHAEIGTGAVEFLVLLDGKTVWSSGRMTRESGARDYA